MHLTIFATAHYALKRQKHYDKNYRVRQVETKDFNLKSIFIFFFVCFRFNEILAVNASSRERSIDYKHS